MTIHNSLPLMQPIAGEAQVPGAEESSSGSKPSLVSSASNDDQLNCAASLISEAASLPDVRAEKVEAVKTAIADGSYNVSSADVARSVVDHMLGKE